MSREDYVVKRIEMIEADLEELKRFISGGNGESISLRSIWAGVDIQDEEIEEAKWSLFKGFEATWRI